MSTGPVPRLPVPAGEVARLRRFLRVRPAEPTLERCDLCAQALPAHHPHLVHVTERSMKCACRPCALLFVDRPTELGGFPGYRTVPERYLRDPDFVLADEHWDALQIPVAVAFFLRNSAQDDIVACYPSPAGATESELDLARWSDGIGAGRLTELLEPDVEALLVRRGAARGETGTATECLLVPIDACYRLVGLVRTHWRGFDGGADAWAHIDAFFDDARSRARDLKPHDSPTGVAS